MDRDTAADADPRGGGDLDNFQDKVLGKIFPG